MLRTRYNQILLTPLVRPLDNNDNKDDQNNQGDQDDQDFFNVLFHSFTLLQSGLVIFC